MSLPAEAAPSGERSSAERVKLVRDFFVQLRKGAKNIGMYRHQAARFPEFLHPAFVALEAALREGALPLKITAEAFVFGDEPVWEPDGSDNVPGRFFREGVRHLIFRPEFSEPELTQLVLIMLSNADRGGEEIVAQLFNASFTHLEYVVVDGFTVGDLTEEQVDVEVDKIVEYLYGRLRGSSDDTLAFARVTAADLELKLQDVEQIRGVLIDGNEVAASYKQRVQEELKRDEGSRLHQQLVSLIFAQLRSGAVKDSDTVVETLLQMLDGMLLQEELGPVAKLLDTLKPLATQGGAGSPAAEVRTKLAARMGEEHRIRRLGEAMNLNAGLDLAGAARYLAELGPGCVGPLLDVLESLTQPERRALLIDALAVLGKDTPQFFAARLNSEKSQTVRDMIAIVDKAGFPERAKYIQQAMRNPNPAVRIEVLTILASSKSVESVHRFVLEASTDKSPQVRAAAFRALVALSPIRASQDLLRLPKLPDWEKRPDAEKQLIYECLGQSATPDALRHVVGLLQQKKSLFGGRKVIESKLLAIHALQAMGDVQAFKLLQSAASSSDSEPDVAAAARKAMLQVKRSFTEAARQTGPARAASGETAAHDDSAEAADALFGEFVATREASAAEAALLRERAAAAREEAAQREIAEMHAERDRLARLAQRKAAGIGPFAHARPPPLAPAPPPVADDSAVADIDIDDGEEVGS